MGCIEEDIPSNMKIFKTPYGLIAVSGKEKCIEWLGDVLDGKIEPVEVITGLQDICYCCDSQDNDDNS